MEIRQRVLGEEHPSTLTSMASLAFALRAQDRSEEALGLMHTCVSLRQRILGSAHPYTRSSVETLKLGSRKIALADCVFLGGLPQNIVQKRLEPFFTSARSCM